MNRAELVEALQRECRTDQMRIEDFLLALSDLCAEALSKGEPFNLGDIGCLSVNPRLSRKNKMLRAAVIFAASESLKKRLQISEESFKKSGAGVCKTCGARPRKVWQYEDCSPCLDAKTREKKSAGGGRAAKARAIQTSETWSLLTGPSEPEKL